MQDGDSEEKTWVPLGEVLQRLTTEGSRHTDVGTEPAGAPREGLHPKSKTPSSPRVGQVVKQRKKEEGPGKNQC